MPMHEHVFLYYSINFFKWEIGSTPVGGGGIATSYMCIDALWGLIVGDTAFPNRDLFDGLNKLLSSIKIISVSQ